MAKTKRRMSAKKLTAILVPILAVVLAFMIALPTVTIGLFDGVLRDFSGRPGEERALRAATTMSMPSITRANIQMKKR